MRVAVVALSSGFAVVSVLAAVACATTFDDALPTYDPDAGTVLLVDSSTEDAEDASFADVQVVPSDGGDAATDGGDAGRNGDAGEAGSQLDSGGDSTAPVNANDDGG